MGTSALSLEAVRTHFASTHRGGTANQRFRGRLRETTSTLSTSPGAESPRIPQARIGLFFSFLAHRRRRRARPAHGCFRHALGEREWQKQDSGPCCSYCTTLG